MLVCCSLTRLVGDVFHTFASQSGLVHDITVIDVDCCAQKGDTRGCFCHSFQPLILTDRTRTQVKYLSLYIFYCVPIDNRPDIIALVDWA